MSHSFHFSDRSLRGNIEIPGDKSISHRAMILASISNGTSYVENFLLADDCMRTVDAFRLMGVPITIQDTTVKIEGVGLTGLKEPKQPIDFGNSGTTARLMIGLLAGLPFFSSVYGDSSLSSRPMNRVVQPLLEMGAFIEGRQNGTYLPLAIKGSRLKGIDYTLPVKSAQVKSALLLAGLTAEGTTVVKETSVTRNHSETMLKAFGADITVQGKRISITNKHTLHGNSMYIPGDISSAAFFLVAATMIPNSEIIIKRVGINPTRTGLLDILSVMGASITIYNETTELGEPIADIQVQYAQTKATIIEGDMIPRLIDEIPILALLATQAEGTTIIRDAEELRVKETDRIKAVVDVLTKLGAQVEETADGMIIQGKSSLKGAALSTYNDHRIAMMAVIASLLTKQPIVLDDISSINISYPGFLTDLKRLVK